MDRTLSNLMKGYFDDAASSVSEPYHVRKLMTESIAPCLTVTASPSKTEWQTVDSPRRLMKEFTFEDQSLLISFVAELLQYQEELQHHAKITFDYGKVIVEVYTHDLNDITELDIEYAQTADKISQDVMFYTYGGNLGE